ncbi:MAG: phospholipase D family protein [Myxococcales bacterium]|nr:phospholipase D family protein [Myxococcales bacterium]
MARRVVDRAARQARVSEPRLARVRLLIDADHYDTLVAEEIPSARVSLWIGTANLKDLRIEAPIGTRARARGRYVSVLETVEGLADGGVEVRILHGRAPSRAFASELRTRSGLANKGLLRECPRVHLKLVIVDGRSLYLGSANFTGAGIGARAETRRNFEVGIVTDDEHVLDTLQARFDAIWSGRECAACGLRRECPKPIDTLGRAPAAARTKAKR